MRNTKRAANPFLRRAVLGPRDAVRAILPSGPAHSGLQAMHIVNLGRETSNPLLLGYAQSLPVRTAELSYIAALLDCRAAPPPDLH